MTAAFYGITIMTILYYAQKTKCKFVLFAQIPLYILYRGNMEKSLFLKKIKKRRF